MSVPAGPASAPRPFPPVAGEEAAVQLFHASTDSEPGLGPGMTQVAGAHGAC